VTSTEDDESPDYLNNVSQDAGVLRPIATVVLFAAILSVVWIVFAAQKPDWVDLASTDVEVSAIVGLLLAALILVSAVALRQTRS